jgi:hypothetical protein
VAVKLAKSLPMQREVSLENLISKVLAAGLAAGLFLLWWPAHLPASGMQWLILRGVAWTLVFEVLVVSFSPLEQMAGRALIRRRAAVPARRVRGKLASAPAPARAGGAVVLAITALLVPVLMLAHAGQPPAKAAAVPPPTVVRKVVVRKVVHEKTVVVRPVPVAGPARVVAAPVATTKTTTTAKAKTTPSTATKPTAKTTPATPDPATLPAPAATVSPATTAADEPVPSS